MKITAVETIPVDQYLFVEVHTDEGITGLGESGVWGYLEASQAVVNTFKQYLIGKDPLTIEHHWQYLYRCFHFRGSAIMGALSAIDVALWDIAGKHFGVPCYQLMGGKCRDRVRVFLQCSGRTKEELVQDCIKAKKKGFTAVYLNCLLNEPRQVPYFKTHINKVRDAIETVRLCREAVGTDVDLCIDVHRRLTPAEAIVLARGIEEFHPFYYEDPALPDNLQATAFVAEKIHIPVAAGERLNTIQEFEMLLASGYVQYIRPDICLAGGFTQTKKIAALAEANYVSVVLHNPLSPVATAICVQLAACIPNFAIHDLPKGEDEPPKSEIVNKPMKVENGFLVLPDAPGIGIELAEDAKECYPFRQREIQTRLHVDGSVIDQ